MILIPIITIITIMNVKREQFEQTKQAILRNKSQYLQIQLSELATRKINYLTQNQQLKEEIERMRDYLPAKRTDGRNNNKEGGTGRKKGTGLKLNMELIMQPTRDAVEQGESGSAVKDGVSSNVKNMAVVNKKESTVKKQLSRATQALTLGYPMKKTLIKFKNTIQKCPNYNQQNLDTANVAPQSSHFEPEQNLKKQLQEKEYYLAQLEEEMNELKKMCAMMAEKQVKKQKREGSSGKLSASACERSLLNCHGDGEDEKFGEDQRLQRWRRNAELQILTGRKSKNMSVQLPNSKDKNYFHPVKRNPIKKGQSSLIVDLSYHVNPRNSEHIKNQIFCENSSQSPRSYAPTERRKTSATTFQSGSRFSQYGTADVKQNCYETKNHRLGNLSGCYENFYGERTDGENEDIGNRTVMVMDEKIDPSLRGSMNNSMMSKNSKNSKNNKNRVIKYSKIITKLSCQGCQGEFKPCAYYQHINQCKYYQSQI